MRIKRKAHSVVIMAIHLLINPSAFSITNPHFGSQLMFNKCIGLLAPAENHSAKRS
ncbi:hypothetical protein BDD14_2100 [Edaphobacter modestus]|uniref:Uncharacterized protein n=1 Tax=Edaphobacter modestus TaxID=388466 RepID=A0A4Q7YSV4_9BACT|nr:hypothetical protein BDD14_2100 [Edaphobacter modestus]